MSSMRATPEPVTAIDSHAHVFRRGLPLAPVHRHAPDYDALLADYLALLDAHAVSHAVLVQPSFLGTDNRFLLDALRACPERLRGVVMVEPSIGEDELAALDRQGVCGVRLNLVGLPIPDFARAEWQRLFARVRALDWHVELHRESRDLPLAGQAILDAGCKLVVDHFGRPGPAPGDDEGFGWLLQSASSGRVWVKLSAMYETSKAGPPLYDDVGRLAKALIRIAPERMLWASNWPHPGHAPQDEAVLLDTLLDWAPDEATRVKILVDNPAELYGF